MPKSLKVKVGNKAKSRQMSSNAITGKYVKQAVRTAKNRVRKLKKHLARQPHDLQAKAALVK